MIKFSPLEPQDLKDREAIKEELVNEAIESVNNWLWYCHQSLQPQPFIWYNDGNNNRRHVAEVIEAVCERFRSAGWNVALSPDKRSHIEFRIPTEPTK